MRGSLWQYQKGCEIFSGSTALAQGREMPKIPDSGDGSTERVLQALPCSWTKPPAYLHPPRVLLQLGWGHSPSPQLSLQPLSRLSSHPKPLGCSCPRAALAAARALTRVLMRAALTIVPRCKGSSRDALALKTNCNFNYFFFQSA